MAPCNRVKNPITRSEKLAVTLSSAGKDLTVTARLLKSESISSSGGGVGGTAKNDSQLRFSEETFIGIPFVANEASSTSTGNASGKITLHEILPSEVSQINENTDLFDLSNCLTKSNYDLPATVSPELYSTDLRVDIPSDESIADADYDPSVYTEYSTGAEMAEQKNIRRRNPKTYHVLTALKVNEQNNTHWNEPEGTRMIEVERVEDGYVVNENTTEKVRLENPEYTNTENPKIDKPNTKIGKKRRKFAAPEEWERCKLKKKIQSGQEHKSISSDKQIRARTVLPVDCSKCPRGCNNKFSPENRNLINEKFWKLSNTDKQRQYLSALIEEKDKFSTRTANELSRRQKTRLFYLVKKMRNIRDAHNIVAVDKRGRHVPGVKLPDESKKYVCDHISSFEAVPSHYTRKDSTKKYLPSDLNITKMYEMYVEKCNTEKIKPVKSCCYIYKNLNEEAKGVASNEYEKHIMRKENAREYKNMFKEKAINKELHFYDFDFEAVRYCPKVKAKAIFYKSRFAVYNFTVYDVACRTATNFVWPESLAGRGSCEVASCLFKLMSTVADGKHFAFISDTCGGQNRNSIVSAMCLYTVETLPIPVIDQIFFEPGHSQMECDSVHAHVETVSKDLEIFDPSGWYTAIRMASKKGKYKVTEISQSDILDFKAIQEAMIKNKKN
ncbi:hypothetical protein NQ314_006228 [Rhamnusium bicolor]|uniref:Uncharacterized protein n=1 Tax=Rhamnusium bicolor TaxID=1586634 RepID=A0AAV8Z703_9CUCU|nr:hypothetical protein NQ314_006228 [Rhamnusium bicolor]